MFLFIKLIAESLRFAWSALYENWLRTILSLLGVTIGIFTIVGVLTFVDALDSSIKKSLSFLGDRVIYVQKWPWGFGGGEYQWWKYMKRPFPKPEEYEFLAENVTWAEAVSMFDVRGGLTAKYKNNSIGSIFTMGASFSHNRVADFTVEKGRYFTPQEANRAANVVIIGSTVADDLFQGAGSVGKIIKLGGIKFTVIGVFEKQGDNLLPTPNFDDLCMIPYNTLAKLFASRSRGLSPDICIKGLESDPDMQNLQGEVTGLMRAYRRLKPKQEDNFALNRSDAAAEFMDTIIWILAVSGVIIASFSFLVGGFGIANIMFVSVKERTNLIGIQKALGAKNYFILSQFLFESVFLSVLGGIIGIGLASFLSFFSTETLIIKLDFLQVVFGILLSCSVGILSGMIPAFLASRMDPVIAIRSK